MQTESLLLELFSRGFGGVVSMVLHDDFDATMHLGPERIAVQSVDPSKETYGRGSMMHRLSFVSSMQPPDALTIAANPKKGRDRSSLCVRCFWRTWPAHPFRDRRQFIRVSQNPGVHSLRDVEVDHWDDLPTGLE